MATITSKSEISMSMTVTLNLTEAEARMLVQLVGYGSKPFLEGYYKVLGKSYLAPHESAVHSFFTSVNRELPPHIREINRINKLLEEAKVKPDER